MPCSIQHIQPPQPIKAPEIMTVSGVFAFWLVESAAARGCGWVADGSVVETVNRLPVRSGDQVAVHIDGDLDGGVTKLLFDVGRAFALLEKEAGVGVAEVVETHAPES